MDFEDLCAELERDRNALLADASPTTPTSRQQTPNLSPSKRIAADISGSISRIRLPNRPTRSFTASSSPSSGLSQTDGTGGSMFCELSRRHACTSARSSGRRARWDLGGAVSKEYTEEGVEAALRVPGGIVWGPEEKEELSELLYLILCVLDLRWMEAKAAGRLLYPTARSLRVTLRHLFASLLTPAPPTGRSP